MHFFYLDESGDSGCNLQDINQPIFVLAGISVADKKWNNTKERFDSVISQFFGGAIPENFELHATHLLSREGESFFVGFSLEQRLQLTKHLLKLIAELGHQIHFFAVDKQRMINTECAYQTIYNNKNPYLVAFDYLITYINWYVKEKLGHSARGMIIMDEKKEHEESIEAIIHNRRYQVTNNQKVKWIVEFSYPVDSRKNPMIQLSDLVALCIRRFLEIEIKNKCVPQQVKQFYGECFHEIVKRVVRHNLVERTGRNLDRLNEYISLVQSKPSMHWRQAYGLRRK